MSEIIVIIAFLTVVSLLIIGEVRYSIRFNRLCEEVERLSRLSDFTDESVLQYTCYVVEQLKQNKKPESFSKWKASLS